MEVIIVAFYSKKSYTYDDLPKLIGYLKRAAIDAYVISEKSYFLEWYDIKGIATKRTRSQRTSAPARSSLPDRVLMEKAEGQTLLAALLN